MCIRTGSWRFVMANISSLLSRVRAASGPDRERFLSYSIPEPNSGCWIWIGTSFSDKRGKRPRGVFTLHGNPMLASRAAMILFKDEDVTGIFVCHHCDNSICVNPEHLYCGDHESNMADMKRRGRHFAAIQPDRVRELGRRMGLANTKARGQGNPKAKLTDRQVLEIFSDKRKTKTLASIYGVDRTTIQRIRRKALWPHTILPALEQKESTDG